MKTLCIAAVVVLSLTSGCQAASLACEKLLKPVDKGPDIRGSWHLVAISSQECWVSTLVNSVLWASLQVNMTATDTPNLYSGTIIYKIFGYCDTETKDYSFENNTLSEVSDVGEIDTDVLLQSGCSDCIVAKNSKDSILYLLSRRKNVTDAELKEFETQAQCLGWNKAEVTNSDHGLSKKSIRKLQLIQNAAARVLTKTRRVDHITPVLRSLHWLPVQQRIYFKIMLLVYKALNGLGPKYISDLLLPYEPSRPLRSSGTGLLSVPRVRTKHGEAAFSFSAPHIWNKVPESCRSAETLSLFKARLKTFLFAVAFN